MKTIITNGLITALASLFFICITFKSDGQIVNIPDANFKAALVANLAINTNNDGEIQVSEAAAYTGSIDVVSLGITDLTGIEAFIAITSLNCNDNPLTSLDVSQNTALGFLACSSNSITSLDVSNNASLTYLECTYSSISTLDVSHNTQLIHFFCYDDVLLNSLNVANGNNHNMDSANFTATYNPSLTCIQVDDVNYSTTNWTVLNGCIDSIVSFHLNCAACIPIVNIPDANFKAALIANHAINTNGDGEIQLCEATEYEGSINVAGLNITDLTGIEAFTALDLLDCNHNSITNLDLTNNTSLTYLNFVSNPLTSIDLSHNLSLSYLACGQSVSSLDVSNNIALAFLDCSYSSVTSLDVSHNTQLTHIFCYDDLLLTSLNVANGNNHNMDSLNFMATYNPSLTCIQVDDVNYSTAHWTVLNGNIDSIASFHLNCAACIPIVNIPDANFKAALIANHAINTNGDGEIQLCEATAYNGSIQVSTLGIADLTGIEAFTAITSLNCNVNPITSLDVSQNTALILLACSSTSITNIDVSHNAALAYFDCSDNSINSLDLSHNTHLTHLNCYDDILLSSLNVANGNNHNMDSTHFVVSNNPSLTCIQVDDVNYSTTNWTVLNGCIDSIASFSLNCGPCAPIVYIPDTNFKAWLVSNPAINTNGDYEIQICEAAAYTGTISVGGFSISDLTGIEAFTSLTYLNCGYNSLFSIDLSHNTALTTLYCYDNALHSLDVTHNTALTYLDCSWNFLTSFDLSQNTALTYLDCSYNYTIDTLNVTYNTALTSISCSINAIQSLDLTHNTALTYLGYSTNPVTSLDLSSNTILVDLECSNNPYLNSLNVANGNNINMTFTTTMDPELSCIQVDDVSWATANWTVAGGNIDSTAYFSLNCPLITGVVTNGNKSTNINIYPNPSTNSITLNNLQNLNCDLRFTDILGREIYHQLIINSTQTTIDVSQWSNGVYFYQLRGDKETLQGKFVKQ